MPDTFFTEPPHWRWLIVLYFFIGGIAGGCFFLAALLHLFGREGDRGIVRTGYYVALIGVAISGILLIVDLDRPERFWHMMIQNKTGRLMFKYWSPMSVGVWGLLAFGLFAFLAALGALHDDGRVRFGVAGRLARRPVSTIIAIAGGVAGFFLAGYTGVLVTGTSIPVWHNAWLMGALFLLSAASTSYALLMLMLMYHGRAHHDPTVDKLARGDRSAILLEIAVLTAMLLLLGAVARPLIAGGFGVIFWLGVVIVGLLAPLVLHGLPWGRLTAERRAMLAAACVLVGGLCLRFVIVMAPQYPMVSPWAL